MSIAKKLLLLVAAALAGLIGVTLLGLHQINQVYESANYCNVNSLPSVIVLDKAVDDFAKLQSLVVQHLLASDDGQKHRLDTQIATVQTAIEAAFKEYEPLLSDDHDKQMLDNDRHALADYAAVSGKALAASNTHNDDEGRRELAASTPAIEKLTSLLQAHREYNVKLSDQGDKDAQSAYHTARLLAAICGLAAVMLSTALGVIISRSIVNPIRQSIGIANRIASGDLTAHINNTSQDEAGQMLKALDVMQASLRQAIVSIQECAESLTESASCMAASSEQLRARSSSQSTATGNMAAAIEELTVSIGHVKDNAGDAENASSQAGTMSEDGAAEVSKTATDIQSIAQEIRSTATTITALGDETQNISSIVSVIREVADQTNLLALNAAIEAARAGEQGRGFAVVADEVRKLAERTRSATQEIAGKIERVQKGAAEAIASMNHSMGRIGEGVGQTHHAAEAIKNISMSARQAAQSVALIATTLNEQASASLQIAGNVERVAQMTEENSTAAIAAANAAKSLTDLAATMRETVSRFHLRES